MSYCRDLFEGKMSEDDVNTFILEMNNYLNHSIGHPNDQTAAYEYELNSIEQQLKIKSIDKKYKRSLLKQKKAFQKRIKQEPQRLKLHTELYNELTEHIGDVMVKTNFLMSYEDVMIAVQRMSEKFLKLPLLNFNRMNIHQLKSYRHVIKNFVKAKPKENFGAWQKYSRDIFRMVATQEETGAGYNLLNHIVGLNDNIFDSQEGYVNAYQVINEHYIRRIEKQLIDKLPNIDNLRFRDRNKKGWDYVHEDGRTVKREVIKKSWQAMSDDEKIKLITQDYINLKADLSDGKVRYLKPTLWQDLTEEEQEFAMNYKQNQTDQWGEEVGGLNHREIQVKNDDGTESVWLMLKRNEDGSDVNNQHEYYPTVLLRKGFVDPETNSESFEGFMNRGSEADWEGTGMEEGFFEAQEYQQYNYTIGTSKNKVTAYTDFQRLSTQPMKEIAGINARQGVEKDYQYNIWQALSLQRDVNKKFITYVKQEAKMLAKETKSLQKQAQKKLEDDGMMNAKEILEEIEDMGGIPVNFLLPNDTDVFVGWDTLLEDVSENYDPRMWDIDEYWSNLDDAIANTQSDVNSLKDNLAEAKSVIDDFAKGIRDGEQLIDGDEYARMQKVYTKLRLRIKDLESAQQHMQQIKDLALLEPTKENQREMINLLKSVHTKHRKTFMNAMDRRRDVGVYPEYVNKTVTNIEYSKLKVHLLKAFLVIDDNNMKHWLYNQAKVAMKDKTAEAGFLHLQYGHQDVADRMNKRRWIPWRSENPLSAQDLARKTSNFTNWVSGNLLDSGSAVINYTQTQSMVEDWGVSLTLEAFEVAKTQEAKEAVAKAGTKSLINAYTDFMASGSAGGNINFATKPSTVISASFNWALLKLNKSDFINQNTGIDKLLISMLPEQDRANYEALRSQRAAFYNQMNFLKKILKRDKTELRENEIRQAKISAKELKILHKRIKQLNGNLNSSQINQLASWMLTWHWNEILENFTFSGAELNMREWTTVQGMIIAEKLGLLNADSPIPLLQQGPALMMGRINTYNTMFGMSREFFPQMFGGYWGPRVFQYKTYTFSEWVREHNTIEALMSSSDGGAWNVPGWSTRVIKTLFRKAGRALRFEGIRGKASYTDKLFNDPDFDISAERFVNLMAIRGMLAMLLVGAFWSPGIAMMAGAAKRFGMSAGVDGGPMRGMQSVYVSTALKAIILLATMTGGDIPDEDKEEEFWEEWRYLLFPVFVNAIISLSQGDFRSGMRPYVRFWKQGDNAYKAIDPLLD